MTSQKCSSAHRVSSWKYNVILKKSNTVNQWVFTWRTTLPNFISIWFETKEPYGFFEERSQQEQEQEQEENCTLGSEMGSVPGPEKF